MAQLDAPASLADVPSLDAIDLEEHPARRRPVVVRFFIAFLVGLIATLAIGAGALYAYDRQYEGRILPGVHVGSVDLSGMTAVQARDALNEAYSSLSQGEVAITSRVGSTRVTYKELGRRLDSDGLVAEALAVGRSGGLVDRVVGSARMAIRGATIEPRLMVDRAVLEDAVADLVGELSRSAADASVRVTPRGYAVTPGVLGRSISPTVSPADVAATLTSLDAPARVELALEVKYTEPSVSTGEADLARDAARRIARTLRLVNGDEAWRLGAATIRKWISFAPTTDGGYEAVVDTSRIGRALQKIARKVRQDPVNASFLVGRGGEVVGVTAGHNGRRLDIDATAARVADALEDRATGAGRPSVEPAMRVVQPSLTTEEARRSAPLMKQISTWETYFPISERNGYGANIWIPASDIDGYVVAPGEWFDFWSAIGPITYERGYRNGGAIINGRTEPQGALAGGICSTSTTLFNAALRGGYEMGARRNHYYYIDRYPIGLDATVFKSGSSVQNMTWRNDTPYPVLIRTTNRSVGSSGYVRFTLYSVPNGRSVQINDGVVKNVLYASDTTQYTSSLPAGTSERVEYPVNGMQVWRTVSVYQDGELLRRNTYYSNYARITGIVLVGTGRAD
jgi:vancomycin resistance protein YoaR